MAQPRLQYYRSPTNTEYEEVKASLEPSFQQILVAGGWNYPTKDPTTKIHKAGTKVKCVAQNIASKEKLSPRTI